ncbi:MAG: Ig-like domain-containing protein, partial [Rhizobiaceae bacterium]
MSNKFYENWDTENGEYIFGEKWHDFVGDKIHAVEDYKGGGSGKDTLIGDSQNERFKGKKGDDLINAMGGNDVVFAGKGNDTVNGGDGDDLIFGDRDKQDSTWHGKGSGGGSSSSNDVIDAGGGNDVVFADQGDDLVIFNYGENANYYNFFDGGIGEDTLKLNFTSQEWQDLNHPDFTLQEELKQFLMLLESTDDSQKKLFQFHTLHLSVMRFEHLQVMVDDEIIDPTNNIPVANPDISETNEDTLVNIDVLENDVIEDDPATIISAIAQNGSVNIKDDSTLDYTPDPDFNGTDTITYIVKDENGETAESTVTVIVNAFNDAPTVSASPSLPIDEAVDASAQDLSDSGTVTFGDVDAMDVVDITFA